jgi:hypothetical protein
MSVTALLTLVAVGGAITAAWIHMRFPWFAPETLAGRALHLAAAVAWLLVAPPLMQLVPGAETDPGSATVALLAIFYPALVYTFLSAIWLARTVQQSLRLG